MAGRDARDKFYIYHLWDLVIEKERRDIGPEHKQWSTEEIVKDIARKVGVSASTINRVKSKKSNNFSDQTLDRLVLFLDNDQYESFGTFMSAIDNNAITRERGAAFRPGGADPYGEVPPDQKGFFSILSSPEFKNKFGDTKVKFTVSFEIELHKLSDEFKTWFKQDINFKSQAFGGATLHTVVIDKPGSMIRATLFYNRFRDSIRRATSKINQKEIKLETLFADDGDAFLKRIKSLSNDD